MNVERLVLEEHPTTWRYLCSDGQVVEVTAYRDDPARRAALAYFEQNTLRPKPAKGAPVWVRIEGAVRLDPERDTGAQLALEVEGELGDYPD